MRRVLSSWSGLVAVVLVASCGSPQKPGGGGATVGSGGGDTGSNGEVSVAGGPVTPEAVCARVTALKNEDCDLVSGNTLTEDECRDEWNRAMNDRGPESRTAHTNLGRCLLDNGSCEAITSCADSLTAAANSGQDDSPFRACEESDVPKPIGLPALEYEKRRGAGALRYSELTTTKQEPIEVCGLRGQLEWLLTATCDDGSSPFPDADHAHAARIRNVGSGGSCGAIVDLYGVPCPEGTYSIYIDMYVCPLPEPEP